MRAGPFVTVVKKPASLRAQHRRGSPSPSPDGKSGRLGRRIPLDVRVLRYQPSPTQYGAFVNDHVIEERVSIACVNPICVTALLPICCGKVAWALGRTDR